VAADHVSYVVQAADPIVQCSCWPCSTSIDCKSTQSPSKDWLDWFSPNM